MNTYYPFGSLQPGRYYQSGGYRFGFNGMLMDNEVTETASRGGTGNSYDYGARMYNPRLGRFFSLDPLKQDYPFVSPYSFGLNNPIINLDKDGEYVINFEGNVTAHIVLDVLYHTELGKILDKYKDNATHHLIIAYTEIRPSTYRELTSPTFNLIEFAPAEWINEEGEYDPINATGGWEVFNIFKDYKLEEGDNTFILLNNVGKLRGSWRQYRKIGSGNENQRIDIEGAKNIFHGIKAHIEFASDGGYGFRSDSEIDSEHEKLDQSGLEEEVLKQLESIDDEVFETIKKTRINEKEQIKEFERWQPLDIESNEKKESE